MGKFGMRKIQEVGKGEGAVRTALIVLGVFVVLLSCLYLATSWILVIPIFVGILLIFLGAKNFLV